MTLPASGAISTDDIMAELRTANPGRAYPISTSDFDVLALAGKSPGSALSIPNDLHGKSSYTPMMVVATSAENEADSTGSSGGGSTISAYPSVTVSGGRGAKTIQWVVLGTTGAPQVTQLTQPQVRVLGGYGPNTNGSASATLRADVTDETGAVVSSNIVTGTVSWYSTV